MAQPGVSANSSRSSLARVKGRARVSARWLARYLETHEAPTIDEAAQVVGALVALGCDGHDAALLGASGHGRTGVWASAASFGNCGK